MAAIRVRLNAAKKQFDIFHNPSRYRLVIAARLKSTSFSVVAQLETLIRMAV